MKKIMKRSIEKIIKGNENGNVIFCLKQMKWILTLMICILLTACGTAEPVSTGNEDETMQAEWPYDDLLEALVRVGDTYNSVGDWDFTKGNHNSYTMKANPDLSIFTIYVNPIATDEIIDDYVNLALAMDKVYDENKNYKKYCKKGKPYFIEFDCHNEIIASMNLDGKNEKDAVRARIVDGMKNIRSEVSKQLDEFHAYLETKEGIERDDAGKYYFVLDSSNISESLAEVEACVQDINVHNPIGANEYAHYIGSMRTMGYIDGSYVLYLDEYGGECVQIGLGEYRNPDIQFAVEAKRLFLFTYYYLVGCGEYNDLAKGFHFYHLIKYPDDDPMMRVTIQSITDVPKDEIIDGVYSMYEYLFKKMDKHGIKPWCDLTFVGEYEDPEDEAYRYNVNVSIPMDRHIEKEEFEEIFVEGCERFRPEEYEMEDDLD